MASVASSCPQIPKGIVNEDGGYMCRICHEVCHSTKDIFTHQDPGILIKELIDDICRLGISPGDGLSRYICSNCHQSVLQFYRFKRSAQEAQSALTCIRKFGEPNRLDARRKESSDASAKRDDAPSRPYRLGGKRKVSSDASATDDDATRKQGQRSTNSLCRLCVNASGFYRNIFMQKHHGIYFYQIINELCSLNVAVGDDFPAWVCQVCHTIVIEFFKFRRLARFKNSSSLSRRSPEESPRFLPGLRLRSEESLLEQRGGEISDRQLGEQQTQAPSVNDSTAEVDSTFLSNGNVVSDGNAALYSSADDEDDIEDYMEWLEYREFLDFVDCFPPPRSGDGQYLELSMLHGMREALSVGGTASGAAQKARERRECLQRRLEAMKSSQESRRRLHELRLMRMKAEIGLKEQKARHMREMMAVKKKILESQEQIEKMKAKTQQLNEWRESIDKKDSASSVNDKGLTLMAAQGTDVAKELPESIPIKEEPRDFIRVGIFPIKAEPMDDTGHHDEPILTHLIHVSPEEDFHPSVALSAERREEETRNESDVNQETVTALNEEKPVAADISSNELNGKNSVKQHRGSGDNAVREVSAKRRMVRRQSSYSTETLRLAVETVASKQCTIWEAANRYKIPWSVLRDYVKISQESGYISSLLSDETTADVGISPKNEDKLVKFVTEMKLRGFGMCPERVKRMAYALALEEYNGQPQEYDVAQHCASDGWLEDLCSRHNLNLGTSTDSTMLPSSHANSTVLTTFYDKLRLIYDRLGVVITPNQVWNCDETSLCCVSSDGSIVTRAGRRYPCGINTESSRELQVSTILSCGSASGAVGPTMVVFKEEGEDSDLSCPDVSIAFSKTGCLDHSMFKKWFKKFTREIKVDRPLILLLDSENNHLSPQVIDAAVESGVILVPVDFLTSASLQPVEVSLMRPLNDLWERYLEEFQHGNSALVPQYRDFLSWFPSAFHAVAVEDGIIAGFCKTRIYPPHGLVLKSTTTSHDKQGAQECVTSMNLDEAEFELRLKDFIRGLHVAPQS